MNSYALSTLLSTLDIEAFRSRYSAMEVLDFFETEEESLFINGLATSPADLLMLSVIQHTESTSHFILLLTAITYFAEILEGKNIKKEDCFTNAKDIIVPLFNEGMGIYKKWIEEGKRKPPIDLLDMFSIVLLSCGLFTQSVDVELTKAILIEGGIEIKEVSGQ